MNKDLIIKVVGGTTAGLLCIGLKIANRRLKKQRNEIFAKLENVVDDYHELVEEYVVATEVVKMHNMTIALQQGYIDVLESDIQNSTKSKKKKA